MLAVRQVVHILLRARQPYADTYWREEIFLRSVQQEVHEGPPPEVPQQGAPQGPVHPAAAGAGGQEDAPADQRHRPLWGHIRTDCGWNAATHTRCV